MITNFEQLEALLGIFYLGEGMSTSNLIWLAASGVLLQLKSQI
jgi:hypothetical protein